MTILANTLDYTLANTIACKENHDSIKLEANDWSLRLSRQGFWSTYRQGRRFFRRCVDGSVVTGSRGLTACTAAASEKLTTDIHQRLTELFAGCKEPPEWLQNASVKNIADYKRQHLLFNQIYPEGVPILPPDRYRDLVIHGAYGCPNRRCSFCIFYRDKPFLPLSLNVFKQHWIQLQDFWGEALYQRDGLFLGSANALALSQRRLLQQLEFVQQQPLNLKRGIAAFLDSDYAPVRSVTEWQQLYQLGLRHLVVGLETGWGTLRAELGKSGLLSRLREDIERAGKAGMTIGLTVLVGAAGEQRSEQHVARTCEFIHSLPLREKDRVYLSIIEWPNDHPAAHRDDRQWMHQELISFKGQLRSLTAARITAYPVDSYRYFA